LGNNGNASLNGGLPKVDYVFDSREMVLDRRDQLVLRNPNGGRVDRVNWALGGFPRRQGVAVALRSVNLNNELGFNWCLASARYGLGDRGTPGQANDCAVAPSAPTKPTVAPIKPPVAAKPQKALTRNPVTPPSGAPLGAPTKLPTSPIKPPAQAPIAPVPAPKMPVAPVVPPVTAPLPPPKTPIAPVAPPFAAPSSYVRDVSAYINSITLSKRTLTLTGTTVEDKALKWLAVTDPYPLLPNSEANKARLRQRFALLNLGFQPASGREIRKKQKIDKFDGFCINFLFLDL
jgi:hypothetical protein